MNTKFATGSDRKRLPLLQGVGPTEHQIISTTQTQLLKPSLIAG
jgi:hypothetical protein